MHQEHQSYAATEVLDLDLERAGDQPPRHAAGAGQRTAKIPRIGRYEIRDVIGCGGFSVVYKGYDPVHRRPVAVKVCDRFDTETRERFRREAAISRLLTHPNLTRVYDYGSQDNDLYLVQEYLQGSDLADLIRRREPRSLARKLDILVQIAGGLACAHSHGVLHRDVKPSNVRVLAEGRVKIMDFGSAKRPRVDSLLTEIGMVVGTIAYLPPECLLGRPSGAAADVFGFGVLAYELLAFRRPFDAHRLPGLIDQVISAAPTPLSDSSPGCPPDVAGCVLRCLEKEPADRWPSFAVLEAELARLRSRYAFAPEGREVA